MKSLISLILVLTTAGTIFAQNAIDKHFSKYKDQDNFTSIQVTGKMFELAGYIEFEHADEEVKQLKDFIATVKSFDCIVGQEVEDVKSLYNRGKKLVGASHEELMHVNDKEGRFTFYIDERKGIVKELVMVGATNKEFMAFSLTGNMNLRDIGKLANSIQSGEFTKFDLLDKHEVHAVKVYPNPADAGQNVTLSYPEQIVGATATVMDIDGREVNKFKLTNAEQTIPTNNLTSGKYIVTIQKDEVSITKKFIVE